MIEIRYTKNYMSIKGHARYAAYGSDIVCAAVSTLIATFVNVYDVNVIEDEPCDMELSWENADTDFLITGLKLVADTYPENVKIIAK